MGDPAMKTWQLRAGLVAGAVALACSITISDLGAQGWATAVPTSARVARGSVLSTAHGVQPRRARDRRRPACRPIRRSTTWARRAACSSRPTPAAQWMPMTDGQIGVGTIGAIDVVRVQPERHLRRHRIGVPARQRLAWRRRVQVDGRRQDVAAHRPAEGRSHRHASASIRRIPTSRTSPCSATSSDRTRSAASTARRTAARPGTRCCR